MRKNLLLVTGIVIGFLMLAMLVTPAFAWYYNEGSTPTNPSVPPSDTNYEAFGPRCDRLLIKLYTTPEAEWDALMATPQEIDITDWPLTQARYDLLKVPPEINRTNLVSVGGEFGIRNLDLNCNPNPYLGAPQNPAYPNPEANLANADPSDDHNPTSDVNFRRAVISCIDRDYYVSTIIGPLSGVALWCALPPATGSQYYNATWFQTLLPYSLTNAAAFLTAGGFKINPITSKIYWDINANDAEDPDEYVNLKFVIRSDDAIRLACGTDIANKLELLGIRVNRMTMDITGARAQWMAAKDAHLYTAGWSLGIYPDSIVLWQGDAGVGVGNSYYWHPGTCYDTGYANDLEFNVASHKVEIAGTYAEAEENMAICNRRMAEAALNGPMFVYSAVEAAARTYVGGTTGETAYVGSYWNGTVMVVGYGLDSYFGFLNMHPQDYERPADGTIRYGMKTADIRSFNSIYAEWVWDNNILSLTYDYVVDSNPYALAINMPSMCANYSVGSYIHPTLGNCTKVTYTLRPDMYWSDGEPITLKDVYFTLIELPKILKSRGYPNPWWQSAIKEILSFTQLDPYNYEVLIDVYSIWAFGLSGAGVRILPEHIWRTIATTGDPSLASPDPNMVSSGPWRIRDYVSSGYVELVANTPGRTVTTPFAGSTPTTNPYGYFRWSPIRKTVQITPASWANKVDKGIYDITVKMFNELYDDTVTLDKTVTITYPNSTVEVIASDALSIASRATDTETFTRALPYGLTVVSVSYTITAPSWCAGVTGDPVVPFWVTIKEDIGGSTYLGVTAPDIKVDGKDISIASKAFGTKPGDARWSSVADVSGDYRVDGKDIGRLARMFGWRPT
jgi:ABC-type transport system substrate-binding protein